MLIRFHDRHLGRHVVRSILHSAGRKLELGGEVASVFSKLRQCRYLTRNAECRDKDTGKFLAFAHHSVEFLLEFRFDIGYCLRRYFHCDAIFPVAIIASLSTWTRDAPLPKSKALFSKKRKKRHWTLLPVQAQVHRLARGSLESNRLFLSSIKSRMKI